jgi:translation initiation factor 2D
MTPGLAGGPPFRAKARKDAIVGIASLEAPSVPLVIGCCEIDVSTLGQVQGARGHAVQTVSWFGDELWAWSSTGKPGRDAPDTLDGWLEDQNIEGITQNTKQLDIQGDDLQDSSTLLAEENKKAVDEPSLKFESSDIVDQKLWNTKGDTFLPMGSYRTDLDQILMILFGRHFASLFTGPFRVRARRITGLTFH